MIKKLIIVSPILIVGSFLAFISYIGFLLLCDLFLWLTKIVVR